MFHLSVQQEEASWLLFSLRQGRSSAAEHAINFRVTAAKIDWDESALRGTLHNSLSETIKDQLALQDEHKSLDELINLAIKMDNRIRDRHLQGKTHVPYFPVKTEPHEQAATNFTIPMEPEPEPMQIGQTCLTPQEWQHHMMAIECLYCGQKGHFVASMSHDVKHSYSPAKQGMLYPWKQVLPSS